MLGNLKFDQFHLVKVTPKGRKSTNNDHNVISSESAQDTSTCKISNHSFHAFSGKCPETSLDGRTDATYNRFFTGESQEDACECLMLLIENMDKGLGLCPTNDNIYSKGSFSEFLFSFVQEEYIICDNCTVKSLAFESTPLLYVTPTDCTSMQEVLMQEHTQKLVKTCSCSGRDTWHIESRQILQQKSHASWSIC